VWRSRITSSPFSTLRSEIISILGMIPSGSFREPAFGFIRLIPWDCAGSEWGMERHLLRLSVPLGRRSGHDYRHLRHA